MKSLTYSKLFSLVLVITLLFTLFSLSGFAQSENKIVEEGSVLSLNALGTASLVGITYDKIINEYFSWEIGVGVAGVGAGVSYYPKKMKLNTFCSYIGIKLNTVALVDVGSGYGGYIPLGVTFFESSRFNFGVDIGPGYARTDLLFDNHSKNMKDNYFILFGNIKIGIRL